MARDEKCNGCQFALHSVPMSQSSCWACKDHSAYTPEPTRPPSPDEDLFEEMYRKVHGDVEAHPENYDDMFAGYENDLNKAVALIEWQKQEIESLTIRMNAFGLAVKSLEEERGKGFLLKENGEVVPLAKQSEWISVEERLPESPSEILVSCCDGVRMMLYEGNNRWWYDPNYMGTAEGYEITHWMPLPEAPEMKGGGE